MRPANFGVKLMRPSFGPAAELPRAWPARRRHGGCSLRLGSPNVIRGNRRAASASAHGTGRTAYTKDVGQTPRDPEREKISSFYPTLREMPVRGGGEAAVR